VSVADLQREAETWTRCLKSPSPSLELAAGFLEEQTTRSAFGNYSVMVSTLSSKFRRKDGICALFTIELRRRQARRTSATVDLSTVSINLIRSFLASILERRRALISSNGCYYRLHGRPSRMGA